MNSIAIVTPWYGEDLIGGAERLAWDLSHALVRAGKDVDVLTTCCRSFHDDWSANYYRPGVTSDDGVTIRRFKADTRDRVAFSRANSALLSVRRDQLRRDCEPLPREKTDAFIRESIGSKTLLHHLVERRRQYDAVLFLPYLYGPTLAGVPLVSDRAFLVPCLHDEAYAYLESVRDVFRQARGLLFNSDGELNVAASLFGPWIHSRASLIGHAIDVVKPPAETISIHGFVPSRARYVLFLGRVDRTKNVDLALRAFERFRAIRRTSALQLVLAGPHASDLPLPDGAIDLGAVTEDEKAALLAHARALLQPSTNESFSRTVYEAWSLRRPVIVHADCAATSEIVAGSGGGWVAGSVQEWTDVLAMLDESGDSLVDGVGMRGRAAALQLGTWDDVAQRAIEAIAHAKSAAHESRIGLTDYVPRAARTASFADGTVNVLSLAPLRTNDVEELAKITAALRKKIQPVRLFVYAENCAPETREQLFALMSRLGLSESLVVLDEDVERRYAALRDATVACAFGAPLDDAGAVREAMNFELPLAAYDDPIARRTIGACGILAERGNPQQAAMLLYLISSEDALRRRIVAETRLVNQSFRSEASSTSPALRVTPRT